MSDAACAWVQLAWVADATRLQACRLCAGWCPLTSHSLRCEQETLKGLDYKRLSEDVVKHAQYHYNPGRDVVFRGEFITVRSLDSF